MLLLTFFRVPSLNGHSLCEWFLLRQLLGRVLKVIVCNDFQNVSSEGLLSLQIVPLSRMVSIVSQLVWSLVPI